MVAYGFLTRCPKMTPPFRTLPKRILLALSTLPFLGVVAAFGIAPDTQTSRITPQTVVQEVAMSPALTADTGNFDFWREERIGRGETLPSLLSRLGIASDDIREFLTSAGEVQSLGRLLPGRNVLARVTASGRLLSFRYLVSESSLVTVNRIDGRLKASEQVVKLDIRPVLRSGSIQASLFGATDAADVPDRVASEMADIFSGDIDFHRDLRRGDHFSVVYEAMYFEGQLVSSGRILAAEFINRGQSYRAIYFKDPQGREGYYSANGNSLRHAFLKSPIPFSRISSGFSAARMHPVLQKMRAHKGIDYAAPTGTPVRAVADAAVTFVGHNGGYGNLVVLDHQGPYSSAYGHLSRYAQGIRRGARVQQGQVIGFVGSTGLASGPHLHYEFRVNGEQRNPMTVKLPAADPLTAQYKPLFVEQSSPLIANLDLLGQTNLSSLD